MPKGYHLKGRRTCFDEPVIQVIADAAQQNPAHSRECDVARDSADVRLRGDELQCLIEFLT